MIDINPNYDPNIFTEPISSNSDVDKWQSVVSILKDFCKNTRGDCIAIVDAPRFLTLNGRLPRLRKTAPNDTFSNTIIPQLKFLTGLNSEYLVMYTQWVETYDSISGNRFWLPPSIKAAQVYVNNDKKNSIQTPPAGSNYGNIDNISAISCHIVQKEADQLYNKSMNFIRQYKGKFALEGQKTTLTKKSIYSRINATRLMLKLERYIRNISQYFVYEANNSQNRNRLLAAIEPMFISQKNNGILQDYKLVCDETNNTPDIIDNNEMKLSVGIKIEQIAEFVLVDFIVTNI